MTKIAFFGYGSLVNTATHSYPDPRPAHLHGWRRVWRGTHLRQAAYLSVEPDEHMSLLGLVAKVPDGDWAALDQREAAYARHDISTRVIHDSDATQTSVYQVSASHITQSKEHPILLSYLDVVVQGYLRVFGHEGVQHFFDTTTGWDAPILDDRAAPVYPRYQRLSDRETALVDRSLATVMEKAE